MRKGGVSNGEGGGGGLEEGMELATAVHWHFFFSPQLSSIVACSPQEQRCEAVWTRRPSKGLGAMAQSIFMLD